LLDTSVYLGQQAKIAVRLVAIPVPDEVANERRRKLRQNRDRRLAPSAEQLALCGWEIFVTNVCRMIWTPRDVSNAYGLRWRIEIIFKAWKSHFKLTHFTNGSKDYIVALIYARLIFITLLQVTFQRFYHWIDHNAPGTHLSLLKFAQFFTLFLVMLTGSTGIANDTLMAQVRKHCTYEQRNDRLTYGQITQSLPS
jgi:hypothetical protein